MELAGWLILPLILLAGMYLYLIAPNLKRRRQPPPWFRGYIAHRGLHGAGAPENTVRAFQRAAERGFGVELDVRLTLDGKLAVHHDDSLLRTCQTDRAISAMTMDELKTFRLLNSDESIPSFEEVIEAVGGRIPMIVELKTAGKRNDELAEKVYRLIGPLADSVCVESFDPRLMRWYRLHAPEMFRGQLAYDPRRKGERGSLLDRAGAHLLCNCLSRPDFVAYDHETDRNPSFRLMRRLFHPPLAAWTVRSEEQSKMLLNRYDVQIFEGFLPEQ